MSPEVPCSHSTILQGIWGLPKTQPEHSGCHAQSCRLRPVPFAAGLLLLPVLSMTEQGEMDRIKAQLTQQDVVLGEDPGIPIPRTKLSVLCPRVWCRNPLESTDGPFSLLESNRLLTPGGMFPPSPFLGACALLHSHPQGAGTKAICLSDLFADLRNSPVAEMRSPCWWNRSS